MHGWLGWIDLLHAPPLFGGSVSCRHDEQLSKLMKAYADRMVRCDDGLGAMRTC